MGGNSLLKLQNGSDIRGYAISSDEMGANLTEVEAQKIAIGFCLWLSKLLGCETDRLKIGVGNDSRITANSLKQGIFKGLCDNGVEVFDCGLASTPSMFMSTIFEQTNFDGGMMITASHLPYNRNGIKFFTKNGGLDKKDITEILMIAAEQSAESSTVPSVKKFDLIDVYSKHLQSVICKGLACKQEDKPLSGLKIVVDAGNGAGGFFATNVIEPLGADISGSCFLEPDGMFPNHVPNPENKEAMEAIRKATLDAKADLGLIFDTDVDRMSAVLPDGKEINRNDLIAMIAAIIAPNNVGATVVTDSVTSDRLTDFLENSLNLRHLCFKRGYKNVINEAKRLEQNGVNAPLAIETSGHGALKENYYLDDGAYLAVKLLIACTTAKKQGKNLSSLISDMASAGVEREIRINITDENFTEYGKKVLEGFEKSAREKGYNVSDNSFEGVRVSFDGEGWFLLRLSLHDPLLPLNIEGKTENDTTHLIEIVKQLLKDFDKLEKSALK